MGRQCKLISNFGIPFHHKQCDSETTDDTACGHWQPTAFFTALLITISERIPLCFGHLFSTVYRTDCLASVVIFVFTCIETGGSAFCFLFIHATPYNPWADVLSRISPRRMPRGNGNGIGTLLEYNFLLSCGGMGMRAGETGSLIFQSPQAYRSGIEYWLAQ